MKTAEYPLPAQKQKDAARKAEGFATPKQDKQPQCVRILPKRVLPVVFLPGIMGSNLRVSAERQKEMKSKNNIAWRPDSLGGTNISKNANSDPRDRQLHLDPNQTTVDIYDPSGSPDISGDKRHENVKIKRKFYSPFLKDDLATTPNGRTAEQKARACGWGEVYFGSYGDLLQHLESCLNNVFYESVLQKKWKNIVGTDPKTWGADSKIPQHALTEDELKKVVSGCWFPVYAVGYNWLRSNGDSAKAVAARIEQIMIDLKKSGYECNQVIVVTHSMGGIVGRALVHPKHGNFQSKVLGVIHGVMPAIGAPAAYKRMRAGFEDQGIIAGRVESIGAKVAGNYGDEVTAVLANSPGGLELLPSDSYGNHWLRVMHNGRVLDAWPKQGDPYREIYKVRGKWYSLFREKWINPSRMPPECGGGSFQRTCEYLDKVQNFHRSIADTYHPNSYAHYGIDQKRQSFGEVIWEVDNNCIDPTGWQNWPIISDTMQGKLELVAGYKASAESGLPFADEISGSIHASIRPPSHPGDQTVPASSADHQLKSGLFKGVFRQLGYEHQNSYKNESVIASTLYSIIRISQSATWKC